MGLGSKENAKHKCRIQFSPTYKRHLCDTSRLSYNSIFRNSGRFISTACVLSSFDSAKV